MGPPFEAAGRKDNPAADVSGEGQAVGVPVQVSLGDAQASCRFARREVLICRSSDLRGGSAG
jgi:hypothetical protein